MPNVFLLLFPNSFSYGVFDNIGSGAVPGRLPNHGFREGSGTGSGAVGDNTWAYFFFWFFKEQLKHPPPLNGEFTADRSR